MAARKRLCSNEDVIAAELGQSFYVENYVLVKSSYHFCFSLSVMTISFEDISNLFQNVMN